MTSENSADGGAPMGAFAGQRPDPRPVDLARAAMIESVEAVLLDLQARNYLLLNTAEPDIPKRVAGVVVDHLAIDVLGKTAAGTVLGQVKP